MTLMVITRLDLCQSPHLCTFLISKAMWPLLKVYLPYSMLYKLELPLIQESITNPSSELTLSIIEVKL